LVHGVHDRAREGDLSREALGPDHYIREAGSTMSITTTRFTNEKVPSWPDSRWRALSGSGRRVLAQRRAVLWLRMPKYPPRISRRKRFV